MAEKKISDLTSKTGINDTDEFVFVDKATTSGDDASTSGQTSKIAFSDLKTAVGTSGPQGFQGADGNDGAPGGNGTIGEPGPQGLTGPQGNQGHQGLTGVGQQGKQGNQGKQGLTGTGAQGKQGLTGTGAQGKQGLTGASGSPWSGGTFTGPINFKSINSSSVSVSAGIDNTKLYVDEAGSLNFRENAASGYTRLHIGNTSPNANGCSIHAMIDTSGPPGTIGIRATGRTKDYGQGLSSKNVEQVKDNIKRVGSTMQYQNSAHRATWTVQYDVKDKYKSYISDGTLENVSPNNPAASTGHLAGLYLQTHYTGMTGARSLHPATGGTGWSMNLGNPADRWQVLYQIASAVITSDKHEKQQIEKLSDVEQKVAVRLKGLIRKYKMNKSVDEKGDEKARIHVGVIAQDVEDAFSSEGLDASNYGVFCKDTIYDVHIDGEPTGMYQDRSDMVLPFEGQTEAPENATLHPRDVYSVRYDELFAFIISAL